MPAKRFSGFRRGKFRRQPSGWNRDSAHLGFPVASASAGLGLDLAVGPGSWLGVVLAERLLG